MATIPIGRQVPSVMPDAQQNRVITPDPSLQSRGAQQLAQTVQQAGFGLLEQKNREDQALARVKASNGLLERETQISTITSDLAEQARLGKISYDQMEAAYNSAVGQLDPVSGQGLSEAEQEGLGISAKRFQIKGLDDVRRLSISARKDAAQGDLAVRMDMLGKDAAMPGANVEQINARMDSEDVDMAGRLAYGEMWTAKKQQFKDDNWTTHATQRVVSAREGLGDLQAIQHDLTADDGFYARKLDPEKRNQLLNTVTGRIYQVKEHQQRQAEMREMKAERVLSQMDRQAASGVPPTPADQQRWKATLAGTSMAGEYGQRIAEMGEVQSLLRMPMAEQQQYLDDKRRQMAANGGTVTQISNLNRLQSAVDNNVKMMREDPLTFNALRTGSDVEPLDIAGIATPDGQAKLSEQLSQRYDIVNSLRKAYGPEVARNPWKPQEQAMLSAALTQADDNTKLQILGAIASSSPTGADYAAAIKPLAADQPITVMAGLAQYRDLKAPDGTSVPKMLMAGNKVLNDKSAILPKDNLFREQFDDVVGNSMLYGTPQREQAFTAFKAIYAGMAGPAGKLSEDLNRKLADKAVEMATGGIGERAGEKVVKPYGMTDKAFDKAVDMELEGLSKRSSLPIGQLEDMPLSPVPGKEGQYYLLNAGRIQLDPKTNEPMVVRAK